MPLLQSVRKQTVLKQVRKECVWEGYIAPSKVSPFHVTDGWHIGHYIQIAGVIDDIDHNGKVIPYVFYMDDEGVQKAVLLDTYLEHYKLHNCNSELGQRIRFWKDVTGDTE